nr:MAG: putative RNA dependent RNA polymerase [Jiangsu mito-like virus 11]
MFYVHNPHCCFIIKQTMRRITRSHPRRVGSVGYLVLNKTFNHWIRLLCWALREDCNPVQMFRSRILGLSVRNGNTFTVKYLKECLRICQHFVAGSPVFLSKGIPVDLAGGLPRIIPGVLRARFRAGDPRAIRVVLTVLSAYRIIRVPGQLKLNTITDPFKGQDDALPKWALERSILWLLQIGNFRKSRELAIEDFVFSGSVGPNSTSSILGVIHDLIAWSRRPDLMEHLERFCNFHKGGKEFFKVLFPYDNRDFWEAGLRPSDEYPANYVGKHRLSKFYLGRLALKEEGAGKVRVFAIADVVTQSVMAPLHGWVFSWLKTLPMDGTFDQLKPLKILQDKIVSGELKTSAIYSYDLSSATDRLPIRVQRDILSLIFGEQFSTAWHHIMTDREWVLLRNKSTSMYIDEDVSVRYSVGQPMGALSSWAMLALTHHTLVQLAASRVGISRFLDYALLGDDIVIANESVAKSYYALMTDELGVDINLDKSLVSSNTFEFAKQIIRGGENLSALGPRNLLLATKTATGVLSLIVDLLNKGVVLEEAEVHEMFKKVPGVNNNKTNALKWTILGPFGLVPTADGLTSQMRLVNSLSAVRVDSLISSIDDALHRKDVESHWKNVEKVSRTLTRLYVWDPAEMFLDDPWVFAANSVRELIINTYQLKLEDMSENPPIRRFIFDGPLILTNHYRQGWGKEVMDYISKKLEAKPTSTPLLDPFANDEQVLLGFKQITKGEDFFALVRQIESEKDIARYGHLM